MSKLSAIAGRMRWLSHSPTPRSIGTYPAEGSRCSPTAKIATSTMPTTNAGITEMKVAKPVIARSTHVVCRRRRERAEREPEHDADHQRQPGDRQADQRPLEKLIGDSAPLHQLRPRSPRNSAVNQSRYWT